jgi:hypothetical protein
MQTNPINSFAGLSDAVSTAAYCGHLESAMRRVTLIVGTMEHAAESSTGQDLAELARVVREEVKEVSALLALHRKKLDDLSGEAMRPHAGELRAA